MNAEVEQYPVFENKVIELIDLLRAEVSISDYLPIIGCCLFLKKEGILRDLYPTNYSTIHKEFSKYIVDRLEAIPDFKNEEVHVDFKRALWIETYLLPSLEKLSEKSLTEICIGLNYIDDKSVNSYFRDFIENFINRISKVSGRSGVGDTQPIELTKLIASLARLSKGDNVYNPFAGVASLGVLIPENVTYFGQEINRATHLVGLFRLLVKGGRKWDDLYSGYVCEDSIENWNPRNEKYDLIFACPPFNLRLRDDYANSYKTADQFLISRGVNDLTAKGKLITVIPQGFLNNEGQEKNLRRELVEADLLEMVIYFPGGLFINTSISFSVIVVNKDKRDKGIIRFVDASPYIENITAKEKRINNEGLYSALNTGDNSDALRTVDTGTIKGNDYDLNVRRYFISSISGSNVVKLGDILTILSTNVLSGILEQFEMTLYKPYNSQPVKSNFGSTGRYVRIRDLKVDKLSFFLDTDNIIQSELPKQAFEIKKSALLLALRWNTLKPTYFEYKGESIFVNNDIIALEVDESKVDLAYLVNELHSDYVLKALSYLRVGSTVPAIRKQDLFNIQIELPSIEEQRAKIKGVKESLIIEKRRELDALRTIHGLENELLEQNTYLRHSLAGPASNLRGSIKSLRKIIEDQILPLIPNAMDLKENPLSSLNFGKYFSIIERDIKRISETLSRTTRVEKSIEEKVLAPIDIVAFIDTYVKEIHDKKDRKFDISYTIDEQTFTDSEILDTKAYVFANKDLLEDLFDNLIDNASKHAFTEFPTRAIQNRSSDIHYRHSYLHNRIEIHILLNSSYAPGRENEYDLIILFSNSGKCFPEDFKFSDFIRKGSKSAETAGSGFGGWYINEIIKKFGGKLDIYFDPGSEGLWEDLATSFEITFPIIQFESNEKI